MRLAFKLAIVAFILSGWSALQAQEKQPHGFLNIPFGATRETLLAGLTSSYDLKPTVLSAWPMCGSGMFLLWTSDNTYTLEHFALDERRFTVLFYLNSDGKFYGFRMKEEEDNRSRIRNAAPPHLEKMCTSELTGTQAQDLLEDALFLKKVFEDKYGSPTRVLQCSAEDICRDADRIFWIQNTNRYLAAVGTITTVFVGYKEKFANMHCPVAVVYDKELRPAAHESLMSAEGTPAITEERKSIKKAAGSF